MELIERDGFLALLQSRFDSIAAGEGHCVFISGEAGLGKTSVVKSFYRQQDDCNIYHGACDALFTPRPLAPLYDIIWQVNSNLLSGGNDEDRAMLFARFFREMSLQDNKSIIIFEDIHWADEATLDFIKFFARRITRLRCLFILTYRDEEINSQHAVRNLLSQLPADSFTRMQLTPLSRHAVDLLSVEKGYKGEDVYSITGGNPFYVSEILSSYSLGIPDNIRDTILSAYNRTEEKSREVWELLSVSPTGFELKYLDILVPLYSSSIENCLALKILYVQDGQIFFKHELFRRTVEASLSPLKRISLNRRILELFKETFEEKGEIERIIHHGKNANEYEMVVHYAPIAAAHAAAVGSHIQASKLYFTAIEYYQEKDSDLLVQFYECYAYECFLSNQVKEAIIYTGKALNVWEEKKEKEKAGNAMRFLSRLWWLDGHWQKAKAYGEKAIECLEDQPSSSIKAMAYSNMSQLKMLFDQPDASLSWGEEAIKIAKQVGDQVSLAHALNNVGSVYMNIQSTHQMGIDMLQQSLDIALKNSFYEHAARAYSNMASNSVKMKNYAFAKDILDEGIKFCEEKNLDYSRSIMLSIKAVLMLETGNWSDAFEISEALLKNENHLSAFTIVTQTVKATIKMRKGDEDAGSLLLEAANRSFESQELQRIIPAMIALLEFEWLTGKSLVKKDELEHYKSTIEHSIYNIEKNELVFWLRRTRNEHLELANVYEGYDITNTKKAEVAARIWEKAGAPYAQAMALFEGNDEDKRKAVKIVHDLGALAVYEKMKLEMKSSGIKSIPRGLRKTTMSNTAQLTLREVEILSLMKEGLQNKEIAGRLFISPKTVDHHISSVLFKLDVNSRTKAVNEAITRKIIK